MTHGVELVGVANPLEVGVFLNIVKSKNIGE